MSREALEYQIKQQFTQEAAEGDLSLRQWREVLAHVSQQKQRQWRWRAIVPSLPRPIATMAASLFLAVMVGSVSLWVVGPWRQAASVEPSISPTPFRGPAGRPAPRTLEATWAVDRDRIRPGEPLAITGVLKNVWDQRIEVISFRQTVTLNEVNTSPQGTALPTPGTPGSWWCIAGTSTCFVLLTVKGKIPQSIEPGDTVTFVAHVPPDVSANLRPGRYNVGIEVTFAHTPGKPEDGTTRIGLNSGILFVVIPPQGAMDRAVQVGEAREANGVRVTVEAIYFTPEKTTIVMLADLRGYRPAKPTAVPTRSSGATPTPAPTATPAGRQYSANPWYRIDGGEWRELTGRGYRETPEGIHIEWTLGPVPADAGTFDLSINRLGDFVYNPGQEVFGPWEWTVRLQ